VTKNLGLLAFVLALMPLVGCGEGGEKVNGRIVEVACGLCQFHMDGRSDCHWAVRIDDQLLMARGDALPSDAEHDAHGPDGMCSVEREARVSGTVYETYFLATEFELLPVAPDTTRTPHEHVH
jgi:hypothetical protein